MKTLFLSLILTLFAGTALAQPYPSYDHREVRKTTSTLYRCYEGWLRVYNGNQQLIGRPAPRVYVDRQTVNPSVGQDFQLEFVLNDSTQQPLVNMEYYHFQWRGCQGSNCSSCQIGWNSTSRGLIDVNGDGTPETPYSGKYRTDYRSDATNDGIVNSPDFTELGVEFGQPALERKWKCDRQLFIDGN